MKNLLNDPFEQLIAQMREIIPLSTSDSEAIVQKFKIKALKKKEFLLQPGEVSVHTRFVAQGCLRCYYIDDEGQERVLQFGIENGWINDLYSYITQTPAKFFLQAIEPSTVLQIHKDQLEQLFNEVPALERFIRLKVQKAYAILQERTINLMSCTAEERYTDFLTKYPNIEQRIPQYMIASYLRITPEFLSSIRKNRTPSPIS